MSAGTKDLVKTVYVERSDGGKGGGREEERREGGREEGGTEGGERREGREGTRYIRGRRETKSHPPFLIRLPAHPSSPSGTTQPRKMSTA